MGNDITIFYFFLMISNDVTTSTVATHIYVTVNSVTGKLCAVTHVIMICDCSTQNINLSRWDKIDGKYRALKIFEKF